MATGRTRGAEALFEPIAIGSLLLKNRIVMAPMTTLYDHGGGGRLDAFYAARAQGGAAMIGINLQALYPGRGGRSGWVPSGEDAACAPLALNHDAYLPRLDRLTHHIRRHDCRVAAQLAVYGFWARDGYGTPAEELSPSGITLDGPQYRPGHERLTFAAAGRPATPDDLAAIRRDIAAAARRAVRAGFDAVQIQATSGNLLSRFLSPLTNRRTDGYGGSPEGRATLLLETIDEVRQHVGRDVPVLVRVNGDDLLNGGMGPKDYATLARCLEAAGVDAIDVAPGWYEARQPIQHMSAPRGAFVYAATAIKEAVSIPVSASTRIPEPFLAAEILRHGCADFISLGTPLIADPEWPDKARSGRVSAIRQCAACGSCWSDLAGSHEPLRCAVNASAGHEETRRLLPAARRKSVVVVGAGPAGMEAARVAAVRGHRVTLVDRGARPGGRLLLAAALPHGAEWLVFADWLWEQLRNLGVTVRLGVHATAAGLLAERHDEIILATGAQPARLTVPGSDLPHVVPFTDVLAGRTPIHGSVVIVGGGRDGCEAALWVRAAGAEGTVVESASAVAADAGVWNAWVTADRLSAAGLAVLTDATVTEIRVDSVTVQTKGRGVIRLPASLVVAAAVREPAAGSSAGLAGRLEGIRPIGDCSGTDGVRAAVEAGFLAGATV
jgi:2,4-dienoyl-CoA reductase (NADPH2)